MIAAAPLLAVYVTFIAKQLFADYLLPDWLDGARQGERIADGSFRFPRMPAFMPL